MSLSSTLHVVCSPSERVSLWATRASIHELPQAGQNDSLNQQLQSLASSDRFQRMCRESGPITSSTSFTKPAYTAAVCLHENGPACLQQTCCNRKSQPIYARVI
jgi:hypothetical protein